MKFIMPLFILLFTSVAWNLSKPTHVNSVSISLFHRSWKFNMVGYSNNFRNGETAGVHIGRKVRKKKKNLVYHDCDASRGSSGGPIFGNFKKDGKNNYQIVALNASEFRNGGNTSLKRVFYEDKNANVAVRVKRVAQKLKDIREDNP